MNEYHIKSLRIIQELLNSVSDEDFLKGYESLEEHIGQTVEEFYPKLTEHERIEKRDGKVDAERLIS